MRRNHEPARLGVPGGVLDPLQAEAAAALALMLYASLTPEGVRVAVEWPIADLQRRHDDRWLKKRRDS